MNERHTHRWHGQGSGVAPYDLVRVTAQISCHSLLSSHRCPVYVGFIISSGVCWPGLADCCLMPCAYNWTERKLTKGERLRLAFDLVAAADTWRFDFIRWFWMNFLLHIEQFLWRGMLVVLKGRVFRLLSVCAAHCWALISFPFDKSDFRVCCYSGSCQLESIGKKCHGNQL